MFSLFFYDLLISLAMKFFHDADEKIKNEAKKKHTIECSLCEIRFWSCLQFIDMLCSHKIAFINELKCNLLNVIYDLKTDAFFFLLLECLDLLFIRHSSLALNISNIHIAEICFGVAFFLSRSVLFCSVRAESSIGARCVAP